jgi:predicted transcriptional regulator
VLNKRVEILFDEKDYRQLEGAARKRRQSVGAVVREAVAKYVTDADRKRRREAVEWIKSQDFGPVGSPEELKEEILTAMDEAIDKNLEAD